MIICFVIMTGKSLLKGVKEVETEHTAKQKKILPEEGRLQKSAGRTQ